MKTFAKVVLVIVVTLVMAATRIVWSSREAYRRAVAAKDIAERHRELSLSARMYAPGNPYARAALEALVEEGRAGGEAGHKAWEEVRATILGTRSFYVPYPELLDEANRALAAQMAAAELDPATPGPHVGSGSLDDRTKWHADRLVVTQSPIIGWTVLAILGLIGWIGAAWQLFGEGFTSDGKLRRQAALYAVGIFVGLAMFYLGLLRA